MDPLTYIVMPDEVVSVVGESVAQQYFVIGFPQGLEAIMASGPDGDVSSPLTLTQPAQVPGTDVPFGLEADMDTPEWVFEPPMEPFFFNPGEDTNIPLLETPPDDSLLIMFEPVEFAALIQVHRDLADAISLIGSAGNGDVFGGWTGQLVYGDNVCRFLSEIQRALLEPVIDNGVSWQLWTEAEVRASLSERLERFLLQTGITRQRIVIENVPIGTTFVDVPETVIQIRRVQWVAGATRVLLPPTDEMQLDNAEIGWQIATPSTPRAYLEQPLPSLQIQLFPIPDTVGNVEMIVVQRPETLSGCSPFPIPSIFVPYIKYGVLADLLVKEGEANDPERATYCEKRYQEGIDLARALLGSKE